MEKENANLDGILTRAVSRATVGIAAGDARSLSEQLEREGNYSADPFSCSVNYDKVSPQDLAVSYNAEIVSPPSYAFKDRPLFSKDGKFSINLESPYAVALLHKQKLRE